MSFRIPFTSSSSVIPQMPAYGSSILILVMFFNSLKMLSWENLVMPVRNTKRSNFSHPLADCRNCAWRCEVLPVFILVHHIKQRGIIFVNQYYHLLARFPIGSLDKWDEADVGINSRIRNAPFLLLFCKLLVEYLSSWAISMCLPMLISNAAPDSLSNPFQLFDGESFEKLLLSFKIALHGSQQQRLSETAWTAQEETSTIRMCHTIYIFRLVNVELILHSDSFESL